MKKTQEEVIATTPSSPQVSSTPKTEMSSKVELSPKKPESEGASETPKSTKTAKKAVDPKGIMRQLFKTRKKSISQKSFGMMMKLQAKDVLTLHLDHR